jgi:hypothetical protein
MLTTTGIRVPDEPKDRPPTLDYASPPRSGTPLYRLLMMAVLFGVGLALLALAVFEHLQGREAAARNISVAGFGVLIGGLLIRFQGKRL